MTRIADALAHPRLGRMASTPRLDVAIPVAVALVLGAATVLTAVLSNGSLVATLAPVLGGAVVWLIWIAPLRVTLGLAMFVGLAADRPGDADDRWASPFVTIGGLMFQNLNKVIDLDALKFSGVFVLLCYLLVVRGYRVLTGRSRDTAGSLQPAAPMLWAMTTALVAVGGAIGFGALRGGDLQMAKIQVQAFLQLLAVAYLFSVSLRGPRDYRGMARLIVAAACVKAAMAVWVRAVLPAAFPDRWGVMRELEYATNHGDSLLFACALAALVAPLFFTPTRRQKQYFLLLTPIIIAGMVANDRRIAWVEAGLAVFAFFAMRPFSLPSRRFVRLLMLASPLLLVYTLLGWTYASRVFAPVQFVRNLVMSERSDGSLDRSTLFRDVENFNLVHTFRLNPLLGRGFGHPFEAAVEGDALPDFKEYGYLPHNSMVGLWSFTGLVGFTGIFSTVVVALFLGARAHAHAGTDQQRMAATGAIGCLVAYAVHLWADIGFTEAPTILLVGLAMAITAQLAATTGAWPAQWRTRPAAARKA